MSDLSEIYKDGTYAALNPDFGDSTAEWKTKSAVDFCKRHSIPAARLAEVGCGGGAILQGVAEALGSESAVGFEPMPEAYAAATKRRAPGLEFRNEGISPDSEGDFDLVLCFDVFEHIEDYFSFLKNLRHIGRNFLFHIPLDMNAQMILRGEPIRRVREQVGHIHYFSKDSALASLAQCGFTIREHEYTRGSDSGCGTLKYKLMSLPRQVAFSVSADHAVRILGGYSLLVWATA